MTATAINKILLVMEADDEQLQAMTKALDLAAMLDASVKVVLASYDSSFDAVNTTGDETAKQIRAGKLKQDEQWLKEKLKSINKPSIRLDSSIVWNKRAYKAVLDAAGDYNPDIVVKSVDTGHSNRFMLLKSGDWELVKQSPCAVLLVHPKSPREYTNILATADVGCVTKGHRQLNKIIIKYARHLAGGDGSKLSLATALPRIDPQLVVAIESTSARIVIKQMEDEYAQEGEAFCRENNINKSDFHFAVGNPEDVVCKVAEDIDAGVIVLGTVARTGIEGLFMGNTAERILHKVGCDVLCVKPGDYLTVSEIETEMGRE